MLTVDYSDVLNGSAALAGMGPSDVGQGEFALFRTFHDRRLQKAWEIHRWPDLVRIEQRTFRALWLSSTTYAATTEVYDPPTAVYYQSLQAANLNNPPSIAGVENSAWWAQCSSAYSGGLWIANGTAYAVGDKVQNPNDLNFYQCFSAHTSGATFDLTKFGILTAFNRYVGYDQVNADGSLQTPIGTVLGATDVNPEITTKAVGLPFVLSYRGVQFVELKKLVSFVWLNFRLRRPRIFGDQWDSTLAYGVGRQVYYQGTGVTISPATGNLFTASQITVAGESPESAPGKWAVVQLPDIFRGYLITGGYADWLTGDGQANKALNFEGMAIESLELEVDKLQRQGGQVNRLNWKS